MVTKMFKIGFILLALSAMLADSDSLMVPVIGMTIGLALMVMGARKEDK